MDFILIRLPVHMECAKDTMMVISDSEEQHKGGKEANDDNA
jgi:hypothetical protein